jgi:hypothetical protein
MYAVTSSASIARLLRSCGCFRASSTSSGWLDTTTFWQNEMQEVGSAAARPRSGSPHELVKNWRSAAQIESRATGASSKRAASRVSLRSTRSSFRPAIPAFSIAARRAGSSSLRRRSSGLKRRRSSLVRSASSPTARARG